MDDFEYATEIEVRYRDLDTMGHVNNAVYATFLEQARMDYFRDVVGAELEDVGGVIAHLEIDYRQAVTLDDDVIVAVRVPELGESSIPMEYEIRADGEVAATAEVVQVAVDPETRESRALPELWRDRISTYEGL
ncbi:acyl-CoA thioesterase [Halomicrococcus sp. NG-SE-24]|uniref:acyl-CoA thioesterase n=1 Tax=Halomicrococcus sp. NG-SE-24 TaxID=3436928 RepID=UPI003D99F583